MMENNIYRPKIKICGITRIEEAACLAAANVDFAGFVMYYQKSRRNVSCDNALAITTRLKELKPDISTVAVTVSPTKEQLAAIEEIGFDYIQIHGELREDVIRNAGIPVLRAFNISDALETENVYREDKIKGIVFDGKIPGNGETFDWSLLRNFDRRGKMLMLAGGLTCDNVSLAIKSVHPDIVDVSSGVEYTGEFRGKDPEKIRMFVDNCRNL